MKTEFEIDGMKIHINDGEKFFIINELKGMIWFNGKVSTLAMRRVPLGTLAKMVQLVKAYVRLSQ